MQKSIHFVNKQKLKVKIYIYIYNSEKNEYQIDLTKQKMCKNNMKRLF